MKNLTISNSTLHKIKKSEIHRLVAGLMRDMNFKVSSVEINFVTGQEILLINKKYLNHNYTTDIITFNYSGENYTLDAEIFISLDEACFNAKKYGIEIRNEVLRLVIHGFLHLAGYDDTDAKDKRKMKYTENKLVTKYINSLTKIANNT